MTIVSNLALIDTLRQTKLLSVQQLDALVDLMRNKLSDARMLARFMLQQGWFTVYQINQLLSGNGRDLTLGPYQIVDKLGQGGQSVVYKARHGETGIMVALKMIRAELLSNPEAANQFMQEMVAMAKLNHPNVVQFHDADKVGENYYCALEYVEGTDLGKYVRLAGALPVAEACDYVRQTALGLQHAYERNIIHRDIKPVNLYLTGEPQQPKLSFSEVPRVGSQIKILDWGLASLRPPREPNAPNIPNVTKAVIGTADYVSPEQALNADAVDIRGDIYSLGCTFYFLLTGQPPFPTGTAMQKILAHQRMEPKPVESSRPDLPFGLGAILKRMMGKKPGERYQTPIAVATALKPYCRTDRLPPVQLYRSAFGRNGATPTVTQDTPLPGALQRPSSAPTLTQFPGSDNTSVEKNGKKA